MDGQDGAYSVIPIIEGIDDDADDNIMLHLHLKESIHYLMPFLPVNRLRG